MAAPRPKKTAVKKKPPVKKTPKPKKPSFLRKDTPRPARDLKPGDMRSQILEKGKPQPAKDLKPGDMRSQALKNAPSKSGFLAKAATKLPLLGIAVEMTANASIAGEGSTVPGQAQKAVEKKMKREIRQGPKLAVTGVKEGITGPTPRWRKEQLGEIKYRTQIGPKRPSKKPAPGSNYSGKSSTYSGYGTSNVPKTNAANTAATTTAAAGSKGGSKAAKAGGSVTNVSKTKVGRQTRYQRDETAMEQKRSSSRPKKSIFSLFRKG